MITADHPLAAVIAILLPLAAVAFVLFICRRGRRDELRGDVSFSQVGGDDKEFRQTLLRREVQLEKRGAVRGIAVKRSVEL